MTTPAVCVIGDALIDELRWPSGAEEHVGGAGLNVAVGLTRLRVKASLVAMVGLDRAGEEIRAFLASFGVALCATDVPVSARAVSDRAAGEPHYVFNEAARNRRVSFDPRQRAELDDASLVVVSSFSLDDAAQTELLADSVTDSRMRLVVDPNPRADLIVDVDAFRAGFESVAARSLLVKIGDEDARLLYGEPLGVVARRLLELGPSVVLATEGAAGASIHLASGSTVHRPIHPMAAPVVDTMGAGDATLASVTATLIRDGLPEAPEQAARLLDTAMAIAAATCRAPGALLRLPEQ
ncbi:PfkB family carbohydrate kinase [Leifsonia sp. LS-T14]|uniref:PfkB family carbohydrate kinase n=1 Tax=unclassified Leifsonia TaxID=2663824 RepID=UPI0035A62810